MSDFERSHLPGEFNILPERRTHHESRILSADPELSIGFWFKYLTFSSI